MNERGRKKRERQRKREMGIGKKARGGIHLVSVITVTAVTG